MVLDRSYGLARGFDHYDDAVSDRFAAGDDGFAERTADRVVDAALAWLATADDRFFLWVHLFDPHASYDPPAPYADRYATPYLGEIAFADAQIGRLRAAIEARWPDDGTLTIVTSDHGESLGEHWESSHALTLYDATQRVPLAMSGPGLPRGQVVSSLVRLADVAPTVLALLGIEPAPGLDGADLRPLLDGSETEERLAYLETLVPHFDFEMSPLYGIRSQEFKYIRAPEPELYDMRRDPAEVHNLGALRIEAERLDHALSERLKGGRPIVASQIPDEQRKAQLESLGYVMDSQGPDGLALGEVGGLDPKRGVPLFTLGRRASRFIDAGRAPEALAMLREFEGNGPLVEIMRADAANHAGEFVAAEAFARSALASDEADSDALFFLAKALEGQQRLDEAAEHYAKVLALDPELAAPAVALGRLAEAKNDRGKARLYYSEALSGSDEAGWRLAALLLEDGDAETAERLLDQVAPEAQASLPAALRLVQAEMTAQRTSQALTRLEAALVAHPGDPNLRALERALSGSR